MKVQKIKHIWTSKNDATSLAYLVSCVKQKRAAGDSKTDPSQRAQTSQPPTEHHERKAHCRRAEVEIIPVALSAHLFITTARKMCTLF